MKIVDSCRVGGPGGGGVRPGVGGDRRWPARSRSSFTVSTDSTGGAGGTDYRSGNVKGLDVGGIVDYSIGSRAVRNGSNRRPPRVSSRARSCQAGGVTATLEQHDTETTTNVVAEEPWRTIVWDDPVNLMTYVSYVFRSYFGYPREEAERLMLRVHTEGAPSSPPAIARRWSDTCRRCTATACRPPCRGPSRDRRRPQRRRGRRIVLEAEEAMLLSELADQVDSVLLLGEADDPRSDWLLPNAYTDDASSSRESSLASTRDASSTASARPPSACATHRRRGRRRHGRADRARPVRGVGVAHVPDRPAAHPRRAGRDHRGGRRRGRRGRGTTTSAPPTSGRIRAGLDARGARPPPTS